MAIAFRAAGSSVTALCPSRGHSLPVTSTVEKCFDYSPLNPLDSLRCAIKISKPDVIIPCDDAAVQHLHELSSLVAGSSDTFEKEIALLIERSIGSQAHYSATATRYKLKQLARQLGLAVPETALIRDASDLDSFQLRQAFPWVLKVDGTWVPE